MLLQIMKNIEISDEKLNKSLNGFANSEYSSDLLISLKEDVPEFMGLKGKKMGPYKKEQKINVPEEIAKILLENKKAELVK